jgi:hypothetical protein
MRYYKYIGSEEKRLAYEDESLQIGCVYSEDYVICEASVGYWANACLYDISTEWELVSEEVKESDQLTLTNIYNSTEFGQKVSAYLDSMKSLLINKNQKYGDSALNPVRIFSKSDSKEQLLVRIDDKLSRIKNGSLDEDEDVVNDLIGYLVLLKISGK